MFMPGGLYMSVVVIIVMWLVSVVLELLMFMPGGLYMSVVVIISVVLVQVVEVLLALVKGGITTKTVLPTTLTIMWNADGVFCSSSSKMLVICSSSISCRASWPFSAA